MLSLICDAAIYLNALGTIKQEVLIFQNYAAFNLTRRKGT